jgi:hypothetical protein
VTGDCLPFLAPIVAHPHWQLQVTAGFRSCEGGTISNTFTFDADGTVTWEQPGALTRRLSLDTGELDRIRTLDRLDCVRPYRRMNEAWFMVGLPTPVRAAHRTFTWQQSAYLPAHSSMGTELGDITTNLMDDYFARRATELGPIDLQLAATNHDEWLKRASGYTVRVHANRITVKRGARLLYAASVVTSDLVDLVDWRLGSTALDPEATDVRGTLTAQGRSLPLALAHDDVREHWFGFADVWDGVDAPRRPGAFVIEAVAAAIGCEWLRSHSNDRELDRERSSCPSRTKPHS